MDLTSPEGATHLIERFKDSVATSLRMFGEYAPTALVIARKSPDGEALNSKGEYELIFVAVPKPRSVDDKDVAAWFLRELAFRTEAVGIAFATEAWTVEGKPDDAAGLQAAVEKVGGASKHPDRKEVVILMVEHRAIGAQAHLGIMRRGKEKPYISKWEVMDPQYGRFVDLLPPEPVTRH